jgi:flagellar M-ring protein FliF
VRRLTAAIVVNDRMAQSATRGKSAVWQPRSADELKHLTALAQAAVGFDTARGDLLTVEDLAFDQNRAQGPASLPGQALAAVESSPVLIKYMALIAGLILILALGVRPAVRRARSPAVQQLPAGASNPLPLGAAAVAALKPPLEAQELDPERIRAQEILDQVAGHLKREPTQSSRLLQSWIHSD